MELFSHFVVQHTTALLDFRDIEESRIHVSLSLQVCVNQESRHPLELNGLNFQGLRVEGADRHEYNGLLVRLWLDQAREGQHVFLKLSYFVERPAAGVTFLQPTVVFCDFESSRARYLLACQDHPCFASTWELHLKARSEYRRLGTGALVSEVTNASDGTVTSIWRQDRAIPAYLVSFVVGRVKCVDGTLFSHPDLDDATVRRTFAATTSVLHWLEKKFGKLPSAKFFQVLVEVSTAIENESLVLYPPSSYVMVSEEEAAERSWTANRVLCHEATHSYFGNLVRVASWSDLWVKEAFAVYFPIVWAHDTGREQESLAMYFRELASCWGHGGARPCCVRPILHGDQMYTTDSYGGGMMRVRNLHGILGDAVFWKGLQHFVSVYAGKAADSHDLMRAMEQVSHQSLQWWFDQWIFSKKIPSLAFSVHGDTLAVEVTNEGSWVFDLDVVDGSLLRFTPEKKKNTIGFGGLLDFNVSQGVPFKLDAKASSVPREVLLASLASPAVSARAKVVLFALLSDEDAESVFRLEHQWGVRAGFCYVHRHRAAKFALYDPHPAVRLIGVQHCSDEKELRNVFGKLRTEYARSQALSRISDVPFLLQHIPGNKAAVERLGELPGGLQHLKKLPKGTPGLSDALASTGDRETIMALLEEQKKTVLSESLVSALIDMREYELLESLYPQYLPEHDYVLKVKGKSQKSTTSASAIKTSLLPKVDWTSIAIGAALGASAVLAMKHFESK